MYQIIFIDYLISALINDSIAFFASAMIFFNETFLSLPEKFSEGATHLLRDVQYFDPNFRECEFSVARMYVPVSSKRDVGGTEHGFARNLHVARRFAAVLRCSFRFERIGGGAARET